MVEELKRSTMQSEADKRQEYQAGKDDPEKGDCGDVPVECIMSHICYKYAAMVMGGLIEAIDYFAGSQGPRVLLRILAREIPMEMMEAMGVKPEMLKGMSENQMIEMLPKMIASKGGPEIKIEKLDNGTYRFTLNECHFLPYSRKKGFCNVTAGLMLGFSQLLTGKPMDIQEIQTIAHGGERCEFIARPKIF